MRIYLKQLIHAHRAWFAVGGGTCVVVAALAAATVASMQPLPASLQLQPRPGADPRLLDRNGIPLGGPLVAGWNVYDAVPLQTVPEFLQEAFLVSEDRRFYVHGGADWSARLHALWQNLVNL
ncbi:MAG TPA: transglycosylase domain-containing protein, partial [Gammaproteobacteria bacterium]|nr:transglycosylase domain-containing protein [Gammaproteobacteria bacterium]